ncbi:unnamed protein product [Nezara viridula]|uniref:Uncharacterized protein n=1 Tax=Nezara viridula TaxID=85310 RepID=A0A9P0EDT9_NEZVI|nr:unnamed protein product [Nezara viridula]
MIHHPRSSSDFLQGQVQQSPVGRLRFTQAQYCTSSVFSLDKLETPSGPGPRLSGATSQRPQITLRTNFNWHKEDGDDSGAVLASVEQLLANDIVLNPLRSNS